MTRRALPPMCTRSPASAQESSPPRRLTWRARSAGLPSRARPVGRQRAVRRAGHRILVDAVRRREVARRRSRRAAPRPFPAAVMPMVVGKPRQRAEVGRERAHRRGAVEHREQRARARPPRAGCAPSASATRARVSASAGAARVGGEVEHQLVVAPLHGQQAAARPERHLGARRLELGHQHERRRQRRVAAQVDLRRRREPAQAERVALRVEERRLREVVLGGDVLHQRLGDRRLQRADGGGVTRERPIGERVDLVERQRGHAAKASTRVAAPAAAGYFQRKPWPVPPLGRGRRGRVLPPDGDDVVPAVAGLEAVGLVRSSRRRRSGSWSRTRRWRCRTGSRRAGSSASTRAVPAAG